VQRDPFPSCEDSLSTRSLFSLTHFPFFFSRPDYTGSFGDRAFFIWSSLPPYRGSRQAFASGFCWHHFLPPPPSGSYLPVNSFPFFLIIEEGTPIWSHEASYSRHGPLLAVPGAFVDPSFCASLFAVPRQGPTPGRMFRNGVAPSPHLLQSPTTILTFSPLAAPLSFLPYPPLDIGNNAGPFPGRHMSDSLLSGSLP